MAVIFSKNSGLNDDLWNEWSTLLIAQMKDMERQMKSMLGKDDTSDNAPVSVPAPKLGSCSECVNPCKDETDPSAAGLCEHFKPKK